MIAAQSGSASQFVPVMQHFSAWHASQSGFDGHAGPWHATPPALPPAPAAPGCPPSPPPLLAAPPLAEDELFVAVAPVGASFELQPRAAATASEANRPPPPRDGPTC